MQTYTLSELESLPTLCVGQADDCKVDEWDGQGRYRVWLSRCGVADGEPYEHKVTVERYVELAGEWWEIDTYSASESSG